ncbi:hybrid sensor histidine kinase/response regulator [Gemmatimonas phototrophica]|nr:ATP-binding protein [Gemmatimonas phototrophica]
MFIIAVVSLTLQFSTTALLSILGRAPRWRRVRWFGAVTLTAGLYSTVDAFAALRAAESVNTSWSLQFNLVFATLHGAAWLVFTYMGPNGRWDSLPPWVRRITIGGTLVALIASISGEVASAETSMLVVPAFDVNFQRSTLSLLGNMLALVPFGFLALSMYRTWQLRMLGEPGTTAVFIGFTLYLLAGIEEFLVAAGVVQFIFLGDLGYVCVVVPVTLQLFRRFRDDADQLDLLTDHLADEIRRRTDERDRAREQMLEQQRLAALGRLAAGVGHEINNPLQYLQFTLEELRECARGMENADALTMIEQSFEGVDRIKQVVEDLRTYVRPSDIELGPLDLREVVRAALRVGAPQWRQGITITTELEPVPLVLGHEGRLVQVVLNPLVNGMQSMLHANDPKATSMQVRTGTTSRGWAQITITDQGPGFDGDVVSRLGEPYVTTKSLQGGTGLGLFVSRGIVEAHGGTMHFANAPSGGAVVCIELPPLDDERVLPLSTSTAVTAEPPQATTVSLRVLMVEDDEQALRALLRGLEAEQLQATGFTHGADALAWLDQHEVDVVVTDLMMPGMSGWEFAAALAQRHPLLRERLVVLTGGASTSEAQAFVEDATLLVLEKPIGRAELATALRHRARS